MRKRCPEHGLVLRKRPGSYSNEANYCPACGKKLIYIAIPYLIKVYFHPAIAIIACILISLFGLFTFLDVRGCVQEIRRNNIVAEKKRNQLVQNLPEDWQPLYVGLSAPFEDRWDVLKNYLKNKEKGSMSHLSADEIKIFLEMIPQSIRIDAFALIIEKMKPESQEKRN